MPRWPSGGLAMAKKKHRTPEQIIHLLRQAEGEPSGGQPGARVCRNPGATEQTYSRRREGYGGGRTHPANPLKDPGRENHRRKRLLAEAELDKAILREAAAGNC